MINDDTSGLFGTDPNSPTPASLRQGVVEAWDGSTGENEVLVGGSLLVNVPVLTSESASLVVGDVVSLVTDGTKWLLLGKVTTPGDPGTVPTWVGDITALAPLTDLATVTTGLVITGSTQESSDSGPRVVINDPAYPGQVVLYTAALAEIEPARIRPIVSGTTSHVIIQGPKTTVPDAAGRLDLSAEGDGTSGADIDADIIHLFGTDTTIDGFGSLRLGDGTDYVTIAGQAVTDADLSDASNTFPASLATLTGTQALTNKDLSSGTNTLPTSVATLTGTQALSNKDLTASTNTFPGQMLTQVLTAAMTGGAVTVPTTEADITGATVTFSTAKANARYAVTASFYFGANTGGSGIATGKLNIDGTNQAAQANFTGATTLDRANVAQSWTGTLAAAGSHTFKLRHIMTGAGTFGVNPTHTALTVQIFE